MAVSAGLDGPERLAWERLCLAAARALVKGAAARPGFTEAATAGVLQRLRRIEDSVTVDARSSFDRTFRASLARRVDRLRWHGLDGELALEQALPRPLAPELHAAPRVLLVGEAGSGKTTMVSRLVMDCCTTPGAPTPFFLPLRAMPPSRFPAARELVEGSVPHLGDEAPRGWVRRVFGRGALLVLDGLDELARDRRRALFDWVEELARDTGGGLRVVITSRPGASHRPAGDLYAGLRGYTVVGVPPLSPRERDELLSRWWKQSGAEGGLDAPRQALSAAGSLAQNPLMVTLLAAAHRDGAHTPSTRASTCLAAVRGLLRRPDAAALGETVEQRLALVSSVALWMVVNGVALVDPTELDEALLGMGLSDPADVRQSMVESSGCLRASPSGVAFTHALLRDTLGAARAVQTANLGLLVERAHDERFREVVLAALSLSGGTVKARLVSRLRSMADRRPERRSRIEALLGGAAVE